MRSIAHPIFLDKGERKTGDDRDRNPGVKERDKRGIIAAGCCYAI